MPYLLNEGGYPWRYFPEYGRCYCLSLLEYFPVAAADIFSIKEKMFLMYCINSIKIGLIVYLTKCCFNKFSSEIAAFIGTCVFMALFIKFGIFTTIITLTYPEFSLTLLLILFLLLYLQGVETDSAACWISAICMAFLSLFFKETAFAIFLIFGMARIILSHKTLSRRELRTDIFLIVLPVCYLLFFYVAVYSPKTKVFYDGLDRSFIHNLLIISKTNIIFIPSVITFVVRFVLVFFMKKSACIFDVFMAVSVFYVFPFAYMGLAASYYFSPSLFFFVAGAVGLVARYGPKLKFPYGSMCLGSIALCVSLIMANFYYVEYKSEQQTWKKITIELLSTIDKLSEDCVELKFFVDDALLSSGNIFLHSVSMWFYETLNIYENFYYNRKNSINLLTKIEDVYNENRKSVVFYYDQGGLWKPPVDNDFVVLDFVFVQALVKKEFTQYFYDIYKEFHNVSRDRGIRPLNLNKVKFSFSELKNQ